MHNHCTMLCNIAQSLHIVEQHQICLGEQCATIAILGKGSAMLHKTFFAIFSLSYMRYKKCKNAQPLHNVMKHCPTIMHCSATLNKRLQHCGTIAHEHKHLKTLTFAQPLCDIAKSVMSCSRWHKPDYALYDIVQPLRKIV